MAKKKVARSNSKKSKAAREAAALLAESLELDDEALAPSDAEAEPDKANGTAQKNTRPPTEAKEDNRDPAADTPEVEPSDDEERRGSDLDLSPDPDPEIDVEADDDEIDAGLDDDDDSEEEDGDDDLEDGDDDPDALLKVQPALVDKIASIVERRVNVMALVENTRRRASDVKSEIFKRVIADYQRQLGEIEEDYEPTAEEMCQSLMAISALESKLREEIEEVNDRIVEMRFRCEVGEFSEEDLFPIEAENQSALKQLNRRMEIIDQTYETCRPFLREKEYEEATGRRYHPEPAPEPEPELELELDPEPDFDEISDLVSAEMIEPPVSRQPPPEVFTEQAKLDQVQAVDEDEGLPTRFELWPDQAVESTDSAADATQASQQLHCYIVLKYQNGSEEYFPLGIDTFAIGRHPQNDLVLSDRGISRRHARVELDSSGRYSISDLSSGNGIFVNGTRTRQKTELNNGDTITMGNCNMIYIERLE